MQSRQQRNTHIKNPIVDDTMEGLKVYTALLERRNYFLNHNELRLRAALELATGVSWDSEDIAGLEGEQLEMKVAERMAMGLNISIPQARERVRHHRAMASPTQLKSPLEAKE
jgi:hypothetical protein